MFSSRQEIIQGGTWGLGVAGSSTREELMPVPDTVPGNGGWGGGGVEEREEGILFRYPHFSLTELPPLLGLSSKGSVTFAHRASSHRGDIVCECTSA